MSLIDHIARFARSPQGRRMVSRASGYARSPQGRAKLQQVRRTIARGRTARRR